MRLSLLAWVVITMGAFAPTPCGALTREAWLHSGPERPGVFQNEGGRTWVEITPAGDRNAFEEAISTADYVELYDGNRRMWLRLHADYAEWRQPPHPEWHRLYSGRWVPAEQVPPLSDYRIRLAYFVPQDREPTANYEKKIRVLMSFVAEFYRRDLQGRGVAVKDLAFQTRADEAVVHLIRGAHPAGYYNGAPEFPPNTSQQYQKIAAEIPPGVGVPKKHLLIVFAETYDAGPSPFEWPGNLARGAHYSNAGGLGIFSAWILRDEFSATTVAAQRPLFFDTTPIKGRTALGHGKPNSPRFEFIEDGFGGVAHELGHALGLPHDCRQNSRDIMCNGFRNIRWNFANPPQPEKGGTFSEDDARLLFSSRFLSPDANRADDVPPDVQMRVVKATLDTKPASVTISVEASDDQALRAISFVARNQDSVVGGRALAGKRETFMQTLTVAQPKSGELEIEAFVTDRGGNLTRRTVTVHKQ